MAALQDSLDAAQSDAEHQLKVQMRKRTLHLGAIERKHEQNGRCPLPRTGDKQQLVICRRSSKQGSGRHLAMPLGATVDGSSRDRSGSKRSRSRK